MNKLTPLPKIVRYSSTAPGFPSAPTNFFNTCARMRLCAHVRTHKPLDYFRCEYSGATAPVPPPNSGATAPRTPTNATTQALPL